MNHNSSCAGQKYSQHIKGTINPSPPRVRFFQSEFATAPITLFVHLLESASLLFSVP